MFAVVLGVCQKVPVCVLVVVTPTAVCLIMIIVYVPLFVCSWERCKFLFEIIQGGFPGGWVGWFLGWGACALVGLRRLVICFMWVCGSFVISSH